VGLANGGKILADRTVVRSSARTLLLGAGDFFAEFVTATDIQFCALEEVIRRLWEGMVVFLWATPDP
jgi:hypothetical protein